MNPIPPPSCDPRDDAEAGLLRALAAALPLQQPRATLVWTAAIDIADREPLGMGPRGERAIVPITGGRFWGEPPYADLCGHIRPGGADRQLLRPDGVKELRAEYEMQTRDGAVLTVLNEVVIDEAVAPQRYAVSMIRLAAPRGPHEWLNRRVFAGTLQGLRPQRQAVLVRGWLLTLD